MKRPLVGVAIAFCAGIALGEWTGVSWMARWLVFMTAWGLAAALARHRLGDVATYAAGLTGGLLAHGLANRHPQPHHLLRLIGDRAQNVTARAMITQEPVRTFWRRPRGEVEREFFFARVEAVDRGEGWERAAGDVVVWLDQPPRDDQLRYGDRIEFDALLRRPMPPTNPGVFDYRLHLERHGLFHEARIHDAADVRLLGHEGGRVMEWGMWLQRRFLESAGRGLERALAGDEPVMVGLLRAMLVGFRPGLTNELAEPFMRTGTLHVFAVSGLHVAVIAGILVGVLRFLRVPRRATALVALPLLLLYTIATGAPASAVRSFLMASVVILGWSLLRPTDLLNSIAAAAIAVLVWRPMQLFDAGFQLSFMVVICLALFVPGPGFLMRILYR
ncbi:MAG: ComEC family competence protein, partial [Verrucomicrobiae bacterium]|nr:ComEC family competence protein [Verrucomicrobiae bacterium]